MRAFRNALFLAVVVGSFFIAAETPYACFYAGTIGFEPWEDMTCEETCETQEYDSLMDECDQTCEQHCGSMWKAEEGTCTEVGSSCQFRCTCYDTSI